MCILVNFIVTYSIVPKGMGPVALDIFLVSCSTPPHSDSDYDNGICVGKLYEDKIIGFFTTYHVITLTSLGERFLRDFRAKAEKDGFNITFKIYDGRSYYSLGEKIPVVYDRNCEGGKRPLRLVACFRY